MSTPEEKSKKNPKTKRPEATGKSNSSCETVNTSDTPKSNKRELLESEVDQQKTVEADSQLPWEERIHKAHGEGSLVLLENLDRSFTSSDVEELVWEAFSKKVSAKRIPMTPYSSPCNGQALVIFNSKAEADLAISLLTDNCLAVGARIVVGSRPSLKAPGNHNTYFGHITLKDKKDAVSTSHYAQPNTIEFEMALEWWLLGKKQEQRRAALFKRQKEELANIFPRPKGSKKEVVDEDG